MCPVVSFSPGGHQRQLYPVFDVVQPHLSMHSSSSFAFYCALQQLLGDVVVSGDVSTLQELPRLVPSMTYYCIPVHPMYVE